MPSICQDESQYLLTYFFVDFYLSMDLLLVMAHLKWGDLLLEISSLGTCYYDDLVPIFCNYNLDIRFFSKKLDFQFVDLS